MDSMNHQNQNLKLDSEKINQRSAKKSHSLYNSVDKNMFKYIQKYFKLGYHIWSIDTETKMPTIGVKWSTRSFEETKQTNDFTNNGVGMRLGRQPNNKFIICVDFDIYYTKNNKIHYDNKSIEYYNECLKLTNKEGIYNSSTCGNYGCLIDITKYTDFIKKLESLGKKTHLNNSETELLISTNLVLPPTKTICKQHKKQCQERSFNNKDKHIFIATDEFINWLDSNLTFEERKIKPSKKKSNNKNIHNNLVFNNSFIPLKKQLKILDNILNDLTEDYYTDYEKWRNIGFALKDYSNCEQVFNLYNKFSKKVLKIDENKYNIKACETVWESEIESDTKIRFSTLLYYHKECSKNKYDFGFLNAKPYNLMEEIEDLNININKIKSQFITNKKGKCTFIDKLKNKIILCKSHTGSGKTCMMERLSKKYKKKDGYNIVSITSRRSLARKHAEQLDISYYEEQFDQHIAIQLDSIEKINYDKDSKVILFLDEVNSLFNHFRNSMAKMTQKRCQLIYELFEIMNKSYACIGVDADLSTPVIEFIKANTEKEIKLYWNQHKLEDLCDIKVFNKKNTLIDMILDRINKNKPIFVCSDRFRDFERDIYIPIINKLNENQKEKVLFFSSEDGNKEEFTRADKWVSYFVFCTPTIVYGIDCNYEAEVFGFYYGGTMNALQCCQQINRIRKPSQINLYFKNDKYYQDYYDWYDVKESYEKIDSKKCSAFTSDMIQKWDSKLINSYKTFVYKTEYQDKVLNNLNYHVTDILERKGHSITYIIKDEKEKRQMTRKEYINYKEEQFEKLCTIIEENDKIEEQNLNKKQIEIDEKYNDKIKRYNERIDLLKNYGLFSEEYNFEKIVNNMTDIEKRLIYDEHMFQTVVKLKKFNKSVEQLTNDIKNNDDIYIESLKTDTYKMICLKKLLSHLQINNIINFNFKDYMKNLKDNKEQEYDITDMIKSYKLRGKKYQKNKFTNTELIILSLDCCKHLFGEVMTCSRAKVNNKDYKYKVFDLNILQSIDQVVKILT
jgi:hypothetical protein